MEVSTRAFNFIVTHKPSLGVTGSIALPIEVVVRLPADCTLTAVQCGHPKLGDSLPPSLLRCSPAVVLWMWMASFSRSSSGRLAWSITEVFFQLMGWRLPQACSATTDFCRDWFRHASRCSFRLVSSLRLVSRCRLCHSCRETGTLHWPASPLVEHSSPWSALIGESGWM